MMHDDVGVRRVFLSNFFALFALEKRNETKKIHQRPAPAKWSFTSTHTSKSSCEFFWSVKLTHRRITQLCTNTARRACTSNAAAKANVYGGSINIITCVWEFVDVARWSPERNLIHMTSSASDKSKDRRTENCYKNFVRFSVHMVRRVRCAGCVCDFEMTVNIRRVTTHIFFGTRIAVPDSSISIFPRLRLVLIIIRLLLIAFYEENNNLKFIFILPRLRLFLRFSFVSYSCRFVYVRRRTHFGFCCLVFWLILVSLTLTLSSLFWFPSRKIFWCQQKDSNQNLFRLKMSCTWSTQRSPICAINETFC